jgi:RimJ/RimL family protein N-acetyltransferase
MRLSYKNLEIRLAARNDAEYLCGYWHESGWHISLEEARERLDNGEEQHMIEADGKVIGDIHHGDIGDNTAEIGVFIRDENARGKGYGISVISIYIDALFNIMGYDKIRIATAVNNSAMRHISENKFGLAPIIHTDAYQELSGTVESYAEYIVTKENWHNRLDYTVSS